MRKLLLATTNTGKIRELQDLLSPLGIEILSPKNFPANPINPVAETGSTFEENARLKARAYASHYSLPALADDSGLSVEALNGAPGVYSARYSGPDATDAGNVRKLLDALTEVPEEKRNAAFVCVLCLALPNDTQQIFSGECRGMVAREPKGTGGFGYDPIFIHPRFNGRSFAEISLEEKNSVSHRGAAMRRLTEYLQTNLQTGQNP